MSGDFWGSQEGCQGENARSWEALGEARPGQSSLSAGAVRYRAWAQSWISAALAARSALLLYDLGERTSC